MAKAKAKARSSASARVLGYVRVSTDEQVTEGVSLDAQESRIRAYCQLHGLVLVAVLREDEGVKSAKTLDRRVLQGVLAKLQAAEADGLVVAKLDRLTRRMRDWTELLEGPFAEGGHFLFSVSEHVETRTAAGRFMLNMLMSVAQWEREVIAERTSEALRHLNEQGFWTGGMPGYGWRPGPRNTDPTGKRLPRQLVPADDELLVIAEAIKLRAEGATLRRICAVLTEKGYRPRAGKAWAPQTIKNMLATRQAG
jgi:DNA invertase Pin-like site-specific DNA recombinase